MNYQLLILNQKKSLYLTALFTASPKLSLVNMSRHSFLLFFPPAILEVTPEIFEATSINIYIKRARSGILLCYGYSLK